MEVDDEDFCKAVSNQARTTKNSTSGLNMGLNDRFSTVERASRTAINLHENDQELEEEEEDDMICSFDQTQASIFHNETRASFNNKFNPVLGK